MQDKAKATVGAEALKKFQVIRSRFYFEEKRFSTDATNEITVRNGTSSPISRVEFEGILTSPGRSVPWVKDKFSYKIPGGPRTRRGGHLEVGSKHPWRMGPRP